MCSQVAERSIFNISPLPDLQKMRSIPLFFTTILHYPEEYRMHSALQRFHTDLNGIFPDDYQDRLEKSKGNGIVLMPYQDFANIRFLPDNGVPYNLRGGIALLPHQSILDAFTIIVVYERINHLQMAYLGELFEISVQPVEGVGEIKYGSHSEASKQFPTDILDRLTPTAVMQKKERALILTKTAAAIRDVADACKEEAKYPNHWTQSVRRWVENIVK